MMGADALLKEVEERRTKALEALEAEYAAKRDEVKKRTDEQVAFVMESAKKESVTLAQKESTKVEGAAKLQAKKMLFDATEKLLESNVALLKQDLAEFAASPAYRTSWPGWSSYATKRLGGKIAVVCRKADEAALKAAGAKVISARPRLHGRVQGRERGPDPGARPHLRGSPAQPRGRRPRGRSSARSSGQPMISTQFAGLGRLRALSLSFLTRTSSTSSQGPRTPRRSPSSSSRRGTGPRSRPPLRSTSPRSSSRSPSTATSSASTGRRCRRSRSSARPP